MNNFSSSYARRKVFLKFIFLSSLFAIPYIFGANHYLITVFIAMFYTTTLSLAWNLLRGMTGEISLGNAAFFGMGAYITCILITMANMNPWVAIPITMCIVGVISGIFFYPCFFLKGPYFALVSLAFCEAVRQFFMNWQFIGRAKGITLGYGEPSFLNIRFYSKTPYYYISLCMVIIVYLFIKSIEKSRLGIELKKEREQKTNSLKNKIIILIFSAMISSMAGCFYADYYRYVDYDLMLQTYSTSFILPAVIGGTAFVEGPVFGVFVIIFLNEILRLKFGDIFPGINLFLYALTLLCIIRYNPEGILGWYMKSKLKLWIDENILKKTAAEEFSA